jgi:hypothetical protein
MSSRRSGRYLRPSREPCPPALPNIHELVDLAPRATVVAPVTLSYIKAGKPVNFLGMLTMTLRKRESGRISGVAWADQ